MKALEAFPKKLRFVVITVVLQLFMGCLVPSKQGSHLRGGSEPNRKYRYLNRDPKKTSAVIEFDEQGDIRDRGRLDEIFQDIRREARSQKLLMVVYIHGWMNNSTSPDRVRFDALLNELSGAEARRGGYKVYGVYLAWRGKPYKNEFGVLNYLTFWTREMSANRVAGISSTEALLASVKAAKSNPNSKAIFIGHSFGALAMEGAVAQATISRLYEPNSGSVSAPADLVVLLNQASSALTAKRMIELLSSKNLGKIDSEHPFIVSVTSRADSATGIAFPLGKRLGNLFDSGREYPAERNSRDEKYPTGALPQSLYIRRTAGHTPWLVSHLIQPAGTPFPEDVINTWNFGGHGEWIIGRRKHAFNQSPYWVVSVPKEFCANHGDIWNSNVKAFISEILRRNGRLNQGSQTVLKVRD